MVGRSLLEVRIWTRDGELFWHLSMPAFPSIAVSIARTAAVLRDQQHGNPGGNHTNPGLWSRKKARQQRSNAQGTEMRLMAEASIRGALSATT
jgi:hypothetical protein